MLAENLGGNGRELGVRIEFSAAWWLCQIAGTLPDSHTLPATSTVPRLRADSAISSRLAGHVVVSAVRGSITRPPVGIVDRAPRLAAAKRPPARRDVHARGLPAYSDRCRSPVVNSVRNCDNSSPRWRCQAACATPILLLCRAPMAARRAVPFGGHHDRTVSQQAGFDFSAAN